MKRSIKEIFKDFIVLSYSNSGNSSENFPNISLNDIKISDYIIYRETNLGGYFLYLYNGTSIYIPIKFLELFSRFVNYTKFESLRNFYRNELDELDSVDLLIYLMSDLIYNLNSLSVSGAHKDIVLDILEKISLKTTKDFRNWIYSSFKIYLMPIELKSLTLNLDI